MIVYCSRKAVGGLPENNRQTEYAVFISRGGRRQPFTAPIMTPFTKYFCTKG